MPMEGAQAGHGSRDACDPGHDRPLRAEDIMTAPVATIGPDARLADIAALLAERRISGLPVVDRGVVAGMVSEGDLLRRYELGTERKPRARWWLPSLAIPPGPADYVKSHAQRAADIMSRPAICVTPDFPVRDIVAVFEKRAIRRVPVLRRGVLVGIVARADVVRALARRIRASAGDRRALSDEAMRQRLLRELASQGWWHAASTVTVERGVAHLWGVRRDDEDADAVRVAAQNVPGVVRVDDHRMYMDEFPSME